MSFGIEMGRSDTAPLACQPFRHRIRIFLPLEDPLCIHELVDREVDVFCTLGVLVSPAIHTQFPLNAFEQFRDRDVKADSQHFERSKTGLAAPIFQLGNVAAPQT